MGCLELGDRVVMILTDCNTLRCRRYNNNEEGFNDLDSDPMR